MKRRRDLVRMDTGLVLIEPNVSANRRDQFKQSMTEAVPIALLCLLEFHATLSGKGTPGRVSRACKEVVVTDDADGFVNIVMKINRRDGTAHITAYDPSVDGLSTTVTVKHPP